jgi:hypothetical protein
VIENAVTFVTFLLGLDGKGINTNAAMGKGRVAPRFTPIRTMDTYRSFTRRGSTNTETEEWLWEIGERQCAISQ